MRWNDSVEQHKVGDIFQKTIFLWWPKRLPVGNKNNLYQTRWLELATISYEYGEFGLCISDYGGWCYNCWKEMFFVF